MPFRIEAVFAREGDCLLLHYGSANDPKVLLIDGGSSSVYANFLRPRLQQLRDDRDGERVPLEMVMVSHVDGDHIVGVLDLFRELQESDDPVCDVGVLWHNSFDDLVDNDSSELTTEILRRNDDGIAPPASADDDTVAITASVRQGRQLREDAAALGISTNDPFSGLVVASTDTVDPIDIGDGLSFRVLGPSKARVEALQTTWDKYLESNNLAEATAAALEDSSVPNLASLVVLAEQGGRRLLLTGDARGDFIVEGLILAGLLPAEAELPILVSGLSRTERRERKERLEQAEALADPPSVHFDLLKMPHHGSERNVSPGFFRRVTADHYLISADGKHENPDVPTLRMLAEERGDRPYTLHFTFTADQHLDPDGNANYKAALAEVHEWVEQEKPDNCTVVHRAGKDALSVVLDFSSPVD